MKQFICISLSIIVYANGTLHATLMNDYVLNIEKKHSVTTQNSQEIVADLQRDTQLSDNDDQDKYGPIICATCVCFIVAGILYLIALHNS